MAFRDIGPLILDAAKAHAGFLQDADRLEKTIRENRRLTTQQYIQNEIQRHEAKKAERKARKRQNAMIGAGAGLIAAPFVLPAIAPGLLTGLGLGSTAGGAAGSATFAGLPGFSGAFVPSVLGTYAGQASAGLGANMLLGGLKG